MFSYSILRGGLRNADFTTTVKLQDAVDKSPRLRVSRAVGEVMEGATFFASPEFSIAGVLVITALWGLKPGKRHIYRFAALLIPVMFFLLVMAEIYGKTVVHHPAPQFFMIKNPTTIFPKYYINDEYSYPSGHAARAAFMSILLGALVASPSAFKLVRNRKFGLKRTVALIAIAIYWAMVGVSRIYLGHHWLSDIIGGTLLGVGTAAIALAGLRRTDSC